METMEPEVEQTPTTSPKVKYAVFAFLLLLIVSIIVYFIYRGKKDLDTCKTDLDTCEKRVCCQCSEGETGGPNPISPPLETTPQFYITPGMWVNILPTSHVQEKGSEFQTLEAARDWVLAKYADQMVCPSDNYIILLWSQNQGNFRYGFGKIRDGVKNSDWDLYAYACKRPEFPISD